MGDLVYFSKSSLGCKSCIHLVQCGKGLWQCSKRVYKDGTTIYPIVDGKRADGWGACKGNVYERLAVKKRGYHVVNT